MKCDLCGKLHKTGIPPDIYDRCCDAVRELERQGKVRRTGERRNGHVVFVPDPSELIERYLLGQATEGPATSAVGKSTKSTRPTRKPFTTTPPRPATSFGVSNSRRRYSAPVRSGMAKSSSLLV
jgi:hypothetical protein